jgi:hypothetical protein
MLRVCLRLYCQCISNGFVRCMFYHSRRRHFPSPYASAAMVEAHPDLAGRRT